MVSVIFFPNSRFEFLSNMFNQCFIFAPILSFELVEVLVPNYACTTTNKNIYLCVYVYIYIYMYVHVSIYYILCIYYSTILYSLLNEMLSFTYDYFHIS